MRDANEPTQIQQSGDEEIEIDLRELFYAFKKKLWLIILVAVLGGGIGAFISKVILKPVYTSTSMIYIMTKENALTKLADLQVGTQLTQDYKVLITSRTVMQNTVSHLGLGYDYVRLRGKIKIDNPKDTRILNINVEDGDPQTAKTIADEVAKSASAYIADIMEQDPPKIIEQGEIPLYKTRPHLGRNTLMGMLLGILIVLALITVETVQDDTIKTEDDIEKYFSVPVLAAIPLIEEKTEKENGESTGQKQHSTTHHESGRKTE